MNPFFLLLIFYVACFGLVGMFAAVLHRSGRSRAIHIRPHNYNRIVGDWPFFECECKKDGCMGWRRRGSNEHAIVRKLFQPDERTEANDGGA